MAEFQPIDVKKYLLTPQKPLDKTDKTPEEGGYSEKKVSLTPQKPLDRTDKTSTKGGSVSSANLLSGETPEEKVLVAAKVSGENTLPRLPLQLAPLVRAAADDLLPTGVTKLPSGHVPDLNRYALAWAAAYLIGDRDEALVRLWEARRAWQTVN
jgi:hypothetical protein